MIRTLANVGLVLLLLAALLASTCLACAPVKAGGCCDPSGHCKKVSKNCDDQPSAVLSPSAAPVALPVAAAEVAPVQLPVFEFDVITTAPVSPPDLSLLHSLRV